MYSLKNSLIVEINKICNSTDFKNKYCEKFKVMPAGLTLDLLYYLDVSNKYQSILVTKHYGYESSTNNGMDVYQDLEDFTYGTETFTDEQYKFVLTYIKENYPDIGKYL